MHHPTPAVTFLDRLAAAERERLLALGRSRSFERGGHLTRELSATDHVAIVTAGWVKICTITPLGHEVVYGIRGPGDLVGELAAIDEHPQARSADVVALTPVDATLVTATDFMAFLATHPRTATALLRELARRLREVSARVMRFGSLDVREQLHQLISDLGHRAGTATRDGIVIDLGLTQHDLAGLLSCSRDAVAKALGSLRADGVLTTSRRCIVLHPASADDA